MRETNWQQVKETFNSIVRLPEEERTKYLEIVEATDGEIYSEVLSLLSADEMKDVLPNSQVNFDFFPDENMISIETQEIEQNAPNQEVSLIGQTIGNRYHIVKAVGSGGMGDVFLAHDRNLMNRETVVKLLKSETLANREVVRKFKQEIEALARLKNPGIVTIFDSGTYGKQPFLVLEYVEGEDLALIISPILFSIRDFIAPDSLALKIKNRQTKLNDYFLKKFSPEAQMFFSGEMLEHKIPVVLRDEFNRLLSDRNLYDATVFNELKVSGVPTNEELDEDRGSLFRFNRKLIESALAGDVIRGQDKKLTSKETAVIFRQLGESLTHGHLKGIIHRDLKPANIMITTNERGGWQTKLIDFGVAKVRESLIAPTTEIGLSFGTRKYMSPEQINANNTLTPQTDVYALGLIAFEVLTGRHIFRTDSFIEQCRMQEQEDFSEITEFRPDLTTQVRDIICRALSYKPESRQASASEFGNSLADALLSGENSNFKTEPIIHTKRTDMVTEILPAPYPTVKIADTEIIGKSSNSRRNLVMLLGAAIVIILLGAGSWLLWQKFQSKPAIADRNTNAPPEQTAGRELNYKLIVQKYYEGKPFQKPFEATGEEIFGDDWRFRLVLNSPQKGNLYLLTENSKTNNLKILFPHPQRNGGLSEVAANEKIETGEMAFDKNQGAEKFWIVWGDRAIPELEAVKSYVNPQDLGSIKDSEKEKAVRAFLVTTAADEKMNEQTAADKQSKKLITTGGVLVKMAEFRHN